MSSPVDLKLVLLGNKNVGKTSLFNRYVYNEFGPTSMTIGAYFGMKQINTQDKAVNLAIWDTAGEEKFDSLTNFYCRNASCAIVVFDLCSADTFQNLPKWVNKVKNEAEQNCQIIIVGNKSDAAEEGMRKVDGQNAQSFAASLGAAFLEVSAKSGVGVADAFEEVVRRTLERQSREAHSANNAGQESQTGSRRVSVTGANGKKKKKCCS